MVRNKNRNLCLQNTLYNKRSAGKHCLFFDNFEHLFIPTIGKTPYPTSPQGGRSNFGKGNPMSLEGKMSHLDLYI
jgi:hypothetical protein